MAQDHHKSPPKITARSGLFVGSILLLALTLRIYLAVIMPWRQDEIVYVDWLGQWFADHLGAYLTQWQHSFYPPQSPVFANPPLAMWLISLGITVGRLLHIPILLAARSVSIILGTTALWLLYLMARRFFDEPTAKLTLFFSAFIPLVVTNHSTAFLDTTLGLLLVIIIWQFFSVIKSKFVSNRQLFWLGLSIGLALLTKFSMAFILAAISLVVLYKLLKARAYLKALLLALVIVIIPPLLWAGLRDPHHISQVMAYLTSKYATLYAWPGQSVNYLLYLVHDVPTTMLALCLAALGFSLKKQPAIPNGSSQILWLLLFTILGLLNLRLFAPTSYSYQLTPLIPLIALVAAWAIVQIKRDSQVGPYLAFACVTATVLELGYMSTTLPSQYYTLSQTALSRLGQINQMVPTGTGSEDLPELSQYIQDSLPSDARIAAFYNDWTLRKYILPTQSVTSLFAEETVATAATRGAGFIVASKYFLADTSPAAQSLQTLQPLKTIEFEGMELAKIYVVPRQTTHVSTIPLNSQWQVGTENSQLTELVSNPTNLAAEFRFDYTSQSPVRYGALTASQPITRPGNATGMALRLYGEGRSKNVYIDLLDQQTGNYDRASIPLNWNGWQSVEIPFHLLKEIQVGLSPQPVDLSKPVTIRISVDSADSETVSIKLADLEFVK
jgi:4-amino-4-deoxy-L-arabinose transferase-like glycosyltransferase